MTRWLVAPVLCALTLPQAAFAQQPAAAPPTTSPERAQTPSEGTPDAAANVEFDTPSEPSPAAAAPAEAANAPIAPPPPPPQLTAPPPPPPAAQGPQRDKRAEPLLAVGLGTFGTFYALTAYAGTAAIDRARENPEGWSEDSVEDTRNRGRALLVPVAGPFIAMRFTDSARRKYWLAVNGSIQAGSVLMAVIGARMFRKHRKAVRRAQVTASASPQGANVGMSMRF